jgi:hypothetical protein
MRGAVGVRRIEVEFQRHRFPTDDDSTTSYHMRVRLPDGASEFAGSSFIARSRYYGSMRDTGGERLALESQELHDKFSIHVQGGDPLAWRQVFDPTLVQYLSTLHSVEWNHSGGEILLRATLNTRFDRVINVVELDQMAALAAAFEARIALVAGGGAYLPAMEVVPRRSMFKRHHLTNDERVVATMRHRDLQRSPEELFAELALLTSAAEVEEVRAKGDSGEFPIDWLDDLVHHRRAERLGIDDAA